MNKQLLNRLRRLERRNIDVQKNWQPNLFIWCLSESTEEAKTRWELENRPLTDADRVCYIGWMTD
jgi:hypothetical protein